MLICTAHDKANLFLQELEIWFYLGVVEALSTIVGDIEDSLEHWRINVHKAKASSPAAATSCKVTICFDLWNV